MIDEILDTQTRPPHDAGVAAFLRAHNADVVARRGELVDATVLPAIVAYRREYPGTIAGVLSYATRSDGCEIVCLYAAHQWDGVGTVLLDSLTSLLPPGTPQWLVTTNDNTDALRFYQRRGFRLHALRPGAVDAARAALKPSIPRIGEYGVPIRDELELRRNPRT